MLQKNSANVKKEDVAEPTQQTTCQIDAKKITKARKAPSAIIAQHKLVEEQTVIKEREDAERKKLEEEVEREKERVILEAEIKKPKPIEVKLELKQSIPPTPEQLEVKAPIKTKIETPPQAPAPVPTPASALTSASAFTPTQVIAKPVAPRTTPMQTYTNVLVRPAPTLPQPKPQVTQPVQGEKKSDENKQVKKEQKDQVIPAKDKELKVVKPKKSHISYKKQAFSRVFDSRATKNSAQSEEETWRRLRNRNQKLKKEIIQIVRPKEIKIRIPISVKDLSYEMKIKASEVIQKLFMQGLPITINDILDDPTTIELIGHEFDCAIIVDTSKEERLQVTFQTVAEEIADTDPKELIYRPPVVTIMGHVNHGKTSIVDSFRNSNIASTEAGLITQHIGAFKCKTKHGDFTILDTPGHEAFTAIRARGARITDIVILVIAGDEGIMVQTKEVIDKAKKANIPIIVAINKMDKPGFNQDNVYRQLADNDLLPEAWGGRIITVNCSAYTKEGIDKLGEMIALQSEMLELKANPNARARGVVIESQLHRSLGAITTLLIQNGSLKLGDPIIFEHEYGRVKMMQDENNNKIKIAAPSSVVIVTGLSGVPAAGNEFVVLGSEKEARKISEDREASIRHKNLRQSKLKSVEHLFKKKIDDIKLKTLNIVLKADVVGSLEAVRETLTNISSEKVELNFISSSVGQISESDIELAQTSKAIIVGFHTNVERHAEKLVKPKNVKIIIKDIIYQLVDEVKLHMATLLDKIREEKEAGEAKVITLLKSSQLGIIAGCQVTDGIIKRSHLIRLFRNGKEIWSGSISSIKRSKDDVKEVKKDIECGILLSDYKTLQVDDIIKSYEVTYTLGTL